MRKTTIIMAAIAALGMISCQKNNLGPEAEMPQGESSLVINLSDGVGTKATTGINDVNIKNAQVFIFNTRNGQIDNAEYKTFTSTTGTCTMNQLTCSYGEKEIWAIVNAPEDYVSTGNVKTVADLKAKTVTLANNSLDALVMSGSTTKSLGSPQETVTVNVERLVSAIVLKSVRNEFAVPAYKDKLSITGAYLMNVPSVQKLDGSILASDNTESPTSSWSAFYGKASSPQPTSLLVDSFTDAQIAFESNYTTLHTFYTFSNDLDKVEGADSKTTKSSTYLVVECKVDGQTCVYPVLLPKIERNKKYEVSLTIKHVGGDPDSPWNKIKFADFTPSISVSAWGSTDITETI